MPKILYRIEASFFTVGIVAEYPEIEHANQVCVFAPPIVKYMQGWQWHRVEEYCQKKGWRLTKNTP